MAQVIPGFMTDEDVTVGTQLQVIINDDARTWELVETAAPSDYDYGGTFTVYDPGTRSRLVLIPVDNMVNQCSRYWSGLHTTVVSNVYDASTLASLAWVAILRMHP